MIIKQDIRPSLPVWQWFHGDAASQGRPWWLDWFSCWRILSYIRCGITRLDDEIWDWCLWSKTTQIPTLQIKYGELSDKVSTEVLRAAWALSSPLSGLIGHVQQMNPWKTLQHFPHALIKPEGPGWHLPQRLIAIVRQPQQHIESCRPPSSSSSRGSEFKIKFFSWEFIIRLCYQKSLKSRKLQEWRAWLKILHFSMFFSLHLGVYI